EPPVANPTRDRLGAQSLVEGLALGVVDLHLPLDPAVGAGFQLPEQFGGEPAAAELRANVEVVHPDAGLALPRGEVPAAEREAGDRSEEHTSELQSRENLVCRLLLARKNR